ncbi:hypothetical protein E2493_11970 [Sphingomonas parva]|uniref:DUF5655 domain-containing protein n=1 Tax=Sphingomonas parva TaxID=2555898 RepID=A0A4Y8ZR17_9SPHN|nr:YdeI/OmpD-associated family protein [Sphingomonas parva]TFI57907.1 hypothetical protein E2493_11970 [Sphingomonas parva]
MSRDPRVDAYIAKQQDFARPILERIRADFHAALPDVEEAIRWGMPAFLHKGRLLANMAGFKAHATLGLRRGSEVVETQASEKAMGQFGRLTSVADLPDERTLRDAIGKAAALAEQGPAPKPKKAPRPDLPVPPDFAAALSGVASAEANFAGFSPSCRREYLEWVTEAKRPETRSKRIAQAVEWIAEGKSRNWKYEKGR